MKQIDNGEKELKFWQRPMVAKSIQHRFGLTQYDVDLGRSLALDAPFCPECGSRCYPKGVTIADGVTKIYWPQCLSSEDKDHGFQKWSKHGTRDPRGRPVGSKNKEKVSPPAPQPAPVVDTPVKQVTVIVPKLEKTVHPEVLRAAKYVIAGERQIYFTGPAGTGKTTAAEHLLEIMSGVDKWSGSKLHMLTVSMSTFVADLAGFLDRLNKGEYFMTELVKALQEPGLIVVDEADKGNPNLAGFWNTILANGKVTTPGGTFQRHVDNVVLFIGNTTGHSPNKQYAGSVRQDFATLDRFRCFNIGFNEQVERSAIPGLNQGLYDLVNHIRAQSLKSGLQRITGLRWLRRCQQAMEIDGGTALNTVKAIMKDESWSDDEILASGLSEFKKETPAVTQSKYY